MKRLLKCLAVSFAVILMPIFAMSGCKEAISAEDIRYVQLLPPEEGSDIAIFDTSMGEIVIQLYTEEVPETVANFKTLVEEGFFDGQVIFYLEPTVAAAAFGSSTPDGNGGKTYQGEKALEAEYSYNLWPFAGSVSAICYQSGSYFSRDIYYDSRSFFMGDIEITDEDRSTMEEYQFPYMLQQAFEEMGGVPGLSQYQLVFGKIIQGMDVVNAMLEVDAEKIDPEDPESATLRPVTDIVINKVTLSTYHEGDYETLDNTMTEEEFEEFEARCAFEEAAQSSGE